MLEYGNARGVCVSVILPSLNVAGYIGGCVKSVLNQTLREIEVLCVDAGSTDGTLEILEKYASEDTRVRVIQSDRKSYGYQINLGIREAAGEYIGIVETDDFIDASMYRELYTYAEEGFPDFVKGGFYDYVEIENRKISREAPRKSLSPIFGKRMDLQQEREKGILDLNHIWTGIYRRDFLLEKGICLNESMGASYQDTGFALLVGLLADTGVYIKESRYYYRRNNDNSSVKSSSKWACVVGELEYVTREMVKRGRCDADVRRLLRKYRLNLYFWNFRRLPEKERGLFLEEVKEELEEYTKDGTVYRWLDDGRKGMLEVMTDRNASECYFKRLEEVENRYRKLMALIREGGKCVLVCAGKYGEFMLLVQEITGITYIDGVADNDRGCQGREWNGYMLTGIPEAVREYGGHWFVVANKGHSGEIREQLTEAGVPRDKILEFDEVLPLARIVELAAEGKHQRENGLGV